MLYDIKLKPNNASGVQKFKHPMSRGRHDYANF